MAFWIKVAIARRFLFCLAAKECTREKKVQFCSLLIKGQYIFIMVGLGEMKNGYILCFGVSPSPPYPPTYLPTYLPIYRSSEVGSDNHQSSSNTHHHFNNLIPFNSPKRSSALILSRNSYHDWLFHPSLIIANQSINQTDRHFSWITCKRSIDRLIVVIIGISRALLE